jgi:hypothetical protein
MAFLRADALAGARAFRDAHVARECWNDEDGPRLLVDAAGIHSPRCSPFGYCTGEDPSCHAYSHEAGTDARVEGGIFDASTQDASGE